MCQWNPLRNEPQNAIEICFACMELRLHVGKATSSPRIFKAIKVVYCYEFWPAEWWECKRFFGDMIRRNNADLTEMYSTWLASKILSK